MLKLISLKKFRLASLFRSFHRAPCFVTTALVNSIPCDSLENDSLSNLSKTMKKAHIIKQRVIKETNRADSSSMSLLKAMFKNRKKEILQDQTFNDLMDELHKIRMAIPRSAKDNDRLKAIKAIKDLFSSFAKKDAEPGKGYLINLHFYSIWLIIMLVNPKLKIKSINTQASGIESTFLYMLGDSALNILSTQELKDKIEETLKLYTSDNIKKSIKAFTNCLYDYQDDIIPAMAWQKLNWGTDRRLFKESVKTVKPLITFSHIKAVLDKIPENLKLGRKKLRVAILLGFFAGLRISEILYLNKTSLIYDGGYTLRIRKSKTRNGIRNIPLSLLVPEKYLKEIVDFFENSDERSGDGPSGKAFLFTDGDPFTGSIEYSNIAAELFRTIHPEMRFHHLRHNFANWFLIRWYVAIFGKEKLQGADYLEEDVFSKKYLEYLRVLLFGYKKSQLGEDKFSHVLPVLARLIGHSGPVTTMTSYVHIFDWLYHLFTSGEDRQNLLKGNALIEDFLQVTYPTLPKCFKKKKTKRQATYETVISEQLRQLERMIKRDSEHYA